MTESVGHPLSKGTREHLKRSRFFLKVASGWPDASEAWWHLLASLYGRAVIELMREAAKLELLTVPLKELDIGLARAIPEFDLVRRIRIRDFHRGAIPNDDRVVMEGDVSVRANQTVTLSFTVAPDNPNPRYLDRAGNVVEADIFLRCGTQFLDPGTGSLDAYLPKFDSILKTSPSG
jgi:hypothetical protein